MIGWIIASPFLLIAALLAIVMFAWSRVTLRFRSVNDQGQGEMEVLYGILFFRFRIMPSRPKKVKLKDYSPEAIRKKEERRRLNAEKKAEKKKAAAEKKEKKKQAKAAEKEAARKNPARAKKLKKKKLKDTLHTVKFFARLAGRLVKKFNGYLRVDISRFVITVGDDDPAKAAVLYGLISQAASYLFGILESCCNIRYKRKAVTAVEVDFLSGKITADLDITIRIKGWHFIALGVHAVAALLTKNKKK